MDERRARLVRRSREIILTNQDASGALLASPDFPTYGYSWLRDGAFITDAMSRVGEAESAESFLAWCRDVVESRREQIDDLVARHQAGEEIPTDEHLHPRFTPDGREAEGEWGNHQLDGYGAWLWALDEHRGRGGLAEDPSSYTAAVEATARYLLAFWDQPCFDAWEEFGGEIHVATLAAVHAGLRVAAAWPGVAADVADAAGGTLATIEARVREAGVRDGHLVKWLGGDHLDASLLFVAIPYGLISAEDPVMRATVDGLEAAGLVHGGVHRFVEDDYYGGGEWVLLAALLGSFRLATGDRDAAEAQLAWVMDQADGNGYLPEQVTGHLLHPEALPEWEATWGSVATPLLWSHAMFLRLEAELAAG